MPASINVLSYPAKSYPVRSAMLKFCCISYLECGSCVGLHVKVNTHLGMRKGRLYAHRGVPQYAGGLVHSLGGDWQPAYEGLYILARSLMYLSASRTPVRPPSQ